MSPASLPGSRGIAVWPAVRMAARTDVGMQRSNNEDAVRIQPCLKPWPLAVLADGMGGYNAGEVASAMAVNLVAAALQREPGGDTSPEAARKELAEALHLANAAIYVAARTTPGCRGMGTTVVAALVLGQEVLLAHLGDSRAYAWRDGRLERITRDHSLVQREIDAGLLSEQEARASQLGHLVTRALGVEREVEPELTRWPLQRGDRLMLCSDGLTDMLGDRELQALFAEAAQLPLLLTTLVDAANAAGGKDNISVVLMEADEGCEALLSL